MQFVSSLDGIGPSQLGHLYAVDLSCEDDLVPFYERLGVVRANAMVRRNYARQNGVPPQG